MVFVWMSNDCIDFGVDEVGELLSCIAARVQLGEILLLRQGKPIKELCSQVLRKQLRLESPTELRSTPESAFNTSQLPRI